MQKLSRVIGFLSYICAYFAGVMLLVTILIVVVEVISRFVLRNPIIFADEFCGYILVAVTFFGLAYTWKERGHIRITFLIDRLPIKVTNWLRVVTLLVALAYATLAVSVSYPFIIDAFHRNIRSNSPLATPLAYPQVVIPLGFTVLTLWLIVEVVKAIGNLRSGVNAETLDG